MSESTNNNPASTIETKKEETGEKKTNVLLIIFVLVIIAVILYIMYVAVCSFKKETRLEGVANALMPERDDPMMDFNLRDTINQLNSMQFKLLQRISNNSAI
jgi:hypothetical protein